MSTDANTLHVSKKMYPAMCVFKNIRPLTCDHTELHNKCVLNCVFLVYVLQKKCVLHGRVHVLFKVCFWYMCCKTNVSFTAEHMCSSQCVFKYMLQNKRVLHGRTYKFFTMCFVYLYCKTNASFTAGQMCSSLCVLCICAGKQMYPLLCVKRMSLWGSYD